MNKPLFSVIVASYNAEKTIGNTIRSVLGQTCKDYEIIVKDACSEDNTILEIPQGSVQIIQKQDKGVYDGMNQAIEYARGEYLIFLNCGDSFFDENVLKKVKDEIISQRQKFDIIYGDYMRADQCVLKQPSKIDDFQLIRKPLTHQSVFFRRSMFQVNGLYDIRFKICADYDFMVRAFLSGAKFLHVNVIICTYEGGGISERNPSLLHYEAGEVRQQFCTKTRLFHFFYQIATLSSIREWIVSNESPEKVKKIYRKLQNLVTR